jgi:hypothetical protein
VLCERGEHYVRVVRVGSFQNLEGSVTCIVPPRNPFSHVAGLIPFPSRRFEILVHIYS